MAVNNFHTKAGTMEKSVAALHPDRQLAVLSGIRNLCRLYWGPDVSQCQEMLEGIFFQPFKDLVTDLSTASVLALNRLDGFWGGVPSVDALVELLHTLHVRLFVSHPVGVVAPPFHSCYLYDGAPLMGPPAVKMQQRIDDLGLSLASHMGEPPDHIAIELECLYYMLEKGWTDPDSHLFPAAISFAGTEIASWLPQFRDRLAQAGDSEPYLSGTRLAHDLVSFISHLVS